MNPDLSTAGPPLPEKRSATWRFARIAFVGLASLITLVALFYAEEDWRGKHAWAQRKRELQAAGDFIEWNAMEPPPVPDNLNFYKAPGIDPVDWTGRGAHALSKRIEEEVGSAWSTNPILIATVSVEKFGHGAALSFDDPAARAQMAKAIEGVLGRSVASPQMFTLIENPLDNLRPATLTLSASRDLVPDDLTNLLPARIGAEQTNARAWLLARPGDNGSFRIELAAGADGASDYLNRAKALEPDFAAFRNALERPYARMDGDYRQPYSVPIPNFVLDRVFAQTLANQTKCHLLLRDAGGALQDLTLLRGICRVLDGQPTGQPMTLLQAMINIAVAGLYADTIADGIQLGVWREPHLAALQRQLSQINLIPILVASFREEGVSSRTTLEATLSQAFATSQGRRAAWLDQIKDPLGRYLAFAPRGWAFQNIVVMSKLQPLDGIGDSRAPQVFPAKAKNAAEEYDALPKSSPFSFLISIFRPNATRAWISAAWIQTKINEAAVACALERYRLARGEFPETLALLAPQFIDQLPHDVIGGQALHYRRQGRSFLLYSVGWDQNDNGGQAVSYTVGWGQKDATGALLRDPYASPGLQNTDWVWPAGEP